MSSMVEATTYKHGELNKVTREAVLEILIEVDRRGMQEFLETYGYKPSLRYQLRYRGKSYPSKAVLGVAAGLRAAEFFGGAAVVVKHLIRLGFMVREGRRVVTAVGLLDLAREARASGDVPETFSIPELPVEPAAYFASGSNNPSEIKGLASVGQDVGVAAPHVRSSGEAELAKLAGSDVQVFVDSGAFSEVEFGPTGPTVVDPILPAEWESRLALYRRLATALGDQVWVVAPDRVGDQAVTLERLTTYVAEIRELASLGARVLVPIQKGALTQAEFAGKVDEVLGDIPWLPAIPCKKAATSEQELGAFLDARPATKHVHLLGLGPTNPNVADYLSHVARHGCSVSMDSNWITANVGRPEAKPQRFMFTGLTTKPRRYTWAQDIARGLLERAKTFVGHVRELAFLICFGLASVLTMTVAED